MSRLYLFISNFTHILQEERQRKKIATESLLLPDFYCIYMYFPHFIMSLTLFASSAQRHDRLEACIFQYFHLFIFFLWAEKKICT